MGDAGRGVEEAGEVVTDKDERPVQLVLAAERTVPVGQERQMPGIGLAVLPGARHVVDEVATNLHFRVGVLEE
ncbi:hypothetical protein UK99_01405 [Frankia casuarinae]|nr:hypothetical protein [Frankia casuarinae]ORT98519.1 hypothetical protein UK99_01405 [Frankia casuarinae]